MIRRKELPEIIDNPKSFNLMGEFMVREGIELSPELAQLKAQLKAQQRQLTSDQLSFISPDVMFTSDVGKVFNEERVTGPYPGLEDKVNWGMGIEVSLPLFEGGKRVALVSQSKLFIEQLRAQQEEMRGQVEEAIRQQLHAIRASYPSIELSAQGAEAARKNYDLVRDKYVRGKCSIVELLDAQKASLNADQAAANAVFAYFIDLMRLQRSVGEYYFFLSDPRRDETINRMMAYIAKGGES
jgi:outer membrane protein TolC